MIPQTFEEWKYCITVDCRIELTKNFASERLSVLQSKENKETQKLIELYGEHHLNNLIEWFEKVQYDVIN